jgi:hypothetical protein
MINREMLELEQQAIRAVLCSVGYSEAGDKQAYESIMRSCVRCTIKQVAPIIKSLHKQLAREHALHGKKNDNLQAIADILRPYLEVNE